MRWWSMQLPVNVLNRHLRLSRAIRKNVDEIAKSMVGWNRVMHFRRKGSWKAMDRFVAY